MKSLTGLVILIASAYIFGFTAAAPQHHNPTPGVTARQIQSRELRNSCAIVATEAFTRLRATGVWTRLLYIGFTDENGVAGGHMICVWQVSEGSPVLAYDQYWWDATAQLPIVTPDLKTVVSTIQKELPKIKITRFHYLN